MPGEIRRIRLIVGLGNPGTEYAGTRHNAGFLAIDRILAKLPKGMEQVHAHESYIWHGNYAGEPLFLQKPLTYMNLSGNAVAPLARRLEISPDELLVIHDDMDIPVGHIRIRKGGSDGGHNGIKSLIGELGTQSFNRLRIGIGRPAAEDGGNDVIDYVLSGFTEQEQVIMGRTLAGAAEAAVLMLRRGVQTAMNGYNGRDWSLTEDGLPEKKTSETEQ